MARASVARMVAGADRRGGARRPAAAGRGSVTLVAVSKTFEADAIRPVLAAGQRVFGENRVQEAQGEMAGARAAIAGHRAAPDRAAADRTRRARRWRCSTPSIRSTAKDRRGARQGDGAARAGGRAFSSRSIPAPSRRRRASRPRRRTPSSRAAGDVHGLAIDGLMCIPPADEAPAPHFALLAKIAKRCGSPGCRWG